MVAILPMFIFQEVNGMLVGFFKKRGIEWDMWHTLILLLSILLIVFYMGGVD